MLYGQQLLHRNSTWRNNNQSTAAFALFAVCPSTGTIRSMKTANQYPVARRKRRSRCSRCRLHPAAHYAVIEANWIAFDHHTPHGSEELSCEEQPGIGQFCM